MLDSFQEPIIIVAPATGELLPLESCSDTVFARGMLGPGFIVRPADGNIRCPVAGTVKLIHASGHGYGITCPTGLETLVHLGVDTVTINDTVFTPQVHVGDSVETGSPLAEAKISIIRAHGCSDEVIVVFSDLDPSSFKLERTGEVVAGEAVAKII